MDPALAFDLDDMLDEETGAPLQEGLFSNTNNAATLQVDGESIVGRYSQGRGAAQKLLAALPIEVTPDGRLVIDIVYLIDVLPFQDMLDAVAVDGGEF